jgi:hypothetical protein
MARLAPPESKPLCALNILLRRFDKPGNWRIVGFVGIGGREEAPEFLVCDLRFAIFEQRAKQGSLTIESDVAALNR